MGGELEVLAAHAASIAGLMPVRDIIQSAGREGQPVLPKTLLSRALS